MRGEADLTIAAGTRSMLNAREQAQSNRALST